MRSVRHEVRDRIGMGRLNRFRRMVAPLLAWNLVALGKLYGTDKAGSTHPYARHYQRHLSSFRWRSVTLLEIGIGGEATEEGGASLRMWRSFFPFATIHGIDIHPKEVVETRIHTHCGSQADATFLDELGVAVGPFDVIIDDGSHRSDHVIASFEALFRDHLTSGGWYVIEDLATAYRDEYCGGPPGSTHTSTAFIQALVDDLNARHWRESPRVALPVAELHCYDQIAFIRRA